MAQTPYIIQTAANNPSAISKVITAGLVVGGLWYARKLYRDWQANKTSDAAGGDINVQNAIKIKEAIQGFGTNEKALFNVASQITDWEAMSKAYRKLYGSNLIDDVKRDVTGTELSKFLNLYNASINKTPEGKPISTKQQGGKNIKGYLVYVNTIANVRSAPIYTSSTTEFLTKYSVPLPGLKIPKSNKIFTAQPGKYLGVATGEVIQDKNSPESTLYIEVETFAISKNAKEVKRIKVYVASSQVTTELKKKDKALKDYEFYRITTEDYNNTLNGFGDNSNYPSKLILNVPSAAVLDTDGNLINMVSEKNLILGHKDSQYTKNNKDYYVFVTIQGQKRMIETNSVKEAA